MSLAFTHDSHSQPEPTHRTRDALIVIGRLSNAIVGHSVNAILGETFDALRMRSNQQIARRLVRDISRHVFNLSRHSSNYTDLTLPGWMVRLIEELEQFLNTVFARIHAISMQSSLTQFLRRRSNGSILEELAHDLREAMDDFEVRAIVSLAHDFASLAPPAVLAPRQSVRAVPDRSRGPSRTTSPQRSQTQ